MRRFRKAMIRFHAESYNGPGYPAVNVKCYTKTITLEDVMERFACGQETAQQALNFQWEMSVEMFWEGAAEMVKTLFGRSAEMYSAGRCGGWLIVQGLGDVEHWDALMVSKWGRLVKWCDDEIAFRNAKDTILSDIDANGWASDRTPFFTLTGSPDAAH